MFFVLGAVAAAITTVMAIATWILGDRLEKKNDIITACNQQAEFLKTRIEVKDKELAECERAISEYRQGTGNKEVADCRASLADSQRALVGVENELKKVKAQHEPPRREPVNWSHTVRTFQAPGVRIRSRTLSDMELSKLGRQEERDWNFVHESQICVLLNGAPVRWVQDVTNGRTKWYEADAECGSKLVHGFIVASFRGEPTLITRR